MLDMIGWGRIFLFVFLSVLLYVYMSWKSFKSGNTANTEYLNRIPNPQSRILNWSECTLTLMTKSFKAQKLSRYYYPICIGELILVCHQQSFSVFKSLVLQCITIVFVFCLIITTHDFLSSVSTPGKCSAANLFSLSDISKPFIALMIESPTRAVTFFVLVSVL